MLEQYEGLGWHCLDEEIYKSLRAELQPQQSPTAHAPALASPSADSRVPGRFFPRKVCGGRKLLRSDYCILLPPEDAAQVSLADSATSMELLYKFLLQVRSTSNFKGIQITETLFRCSEFRSETCFVTPLTLSVLLNIFQDKPIARKFHATTGSQWILLCPPHLQDHCATSVHAIQACAGRNAVRKTIRGHNIANVPDSVIDPILQSCPTCLVTKNPPPVRECTAIRPKQSEDRIQAWDVTTLGEGTDAVIHTVEQLPQLFVVAAAMVKSCMAYEPPTSVRCDNGPAFIGELLQVLFSLRCIHHAFRIHGILLIVFATPMVPAFLAGGHRYPEIWLGCIENELDMAHAEHDFYWPVIDELHQFFPTVYPPC